MSSEADNVANVAYLATCHYSLCDLDGQQCHTVQCPITIKLHNIYMYSYGCADSITHCGYLIIVEHSIVSPQRSDIQITLQTDRQTNLI